MNPFHRAQKVIEIANRLAMKSGKHAYRLDEIQLYEGYAEPGYGDGLVALGNWNSTGAYPAPKDKRHLDNLMVRVGSILEKIGFSLDWNDEYVECSECNKPVRSTADSYGWERSYLWLGDCDVVCLGCLTDSHKEEYLQDIEGDTKKAVPSMIKPDKYGYQEVDMEFANGLHGGQADSPEKIAVVLRAMNIERFVFRIRSVGQFDVHFEVYVHEDELGQDVDKRLQEIAAHLSGAPITGPDPARMMEKALASCKIHSSPDGVVYNKINLSDGTVTTRIVSQEEFIKGIKD